MCPYKNIDLHPGLAELQLAGQLLPGEHIRVGGAFERPLQFLELVSGERGPGLLLLWAVAFLPLLLRLAGCEC